MAGPALSAAVVPLSTKIPVPMTAPMPSVTRLIGPSTRRSACSPVMDASVLIRSIDFVAKIDMPPTVHGRAAVGLARSATSWDRLSADAQLQRSRDRRRTTSLSHAGAVLRGSQPGVALEAAREVTLIAEAPAYAISLSPAGPTS